MATESTAKRGFRPSRRVLWALPFLVAAVLAAVIVPMAGSGHSRPVRLPPGLAVIPFPDTPDAAPDSQIIFSSLARRDLRSVTVRGSRSGVHGGHLITLPAGAGLAFVPGRKFTPGELVRVNAKLASRQAAAAAGNPRGRHLRFSFTVQALAPADGPSHHGGSKGGPSAKKADPVTQHFRSQPGLQVPVVHSNPDGDPHSGDIFLTPNNAPQNGPMIVDSQGRLIWFRPLINRSAFDLRLEHYQGHRVLTWWQGKVLPGGFGGDGRDVIADRSYRTLAVLRAGHGYSSDLHEFVLGRHGTAWIDAFVPVRADLRAVGGPARGKVLDNVIQELDIKTGRVLWEWHALGHIPISASYRGTPGSRPYDYFHLNSVQQLRNGNLLISARNTWGIYEINRHTGHVMWTLGGKLSHFRMGDGANFEWQHDAHLTGHTLTLYDDAWDGVNHHQQERESSGLVLHLNFRARTTTLEHRYYHPRPLISSSEGSLQTLPNGKVFISWGGEPEFSEYTVSGRQIFNASFALGIDTYRAYRFPWNGQPQGRPSMALSRQSPPGLTVYASWNGATQVAYWRVLAGSAANSLSPVRQVRWGGFETVVMLKGRPRYVAVQAIGSHGHVLGTSTVHASQGH